MQLVPLHPGTVLCHPDFPLHPAARLQAKIVTLEAVRVPLLVGSTVVTHQLDPKTGEIFKTRWGCTAVVEYSLPIA
jgi:hypothetical protein